MIKVPPYLRKGDTVGLICPAGFMAKDRTDTCVEVLKQWGFQVKLGKTVGHQHHYFSGTDDERLEDLQQMIDDPEVHAILCARGGYGTSRIIDRVKWTLFQEHPKWIVGYSDITVLHNHLEKHLGIASLHAPMAGAFAEANGVDEFTITLNWALSGDYLEYQAPVHALNRFGNTEGKLIGGNLSLVAHLIGTQSMPDTNGAILFLEDVGEYLYNVDRMLLQLHRADKLKPLAGIIFGSFTDMKDTVIPFGKSLEEILFERIQHYTFPVAFNFPAGHSAENVALRMGMVHSLSVTEIGTTFISKP
jgi:muramoyltetrapeptide carboxypeptidase